MSLLLKITLHLQKIIKITIFVQKIENFLKPIDQIKRVITNPNWKGFM